MDEPGESEPPLDPVIAALDDEDCRRILRTATEPMTAQQVCESCDLPSSTAYRKLDLLTDAQLVAETTEIRSDGHHTTHYRTDVREIRIRLADSDAFELSVTRPEHDAADRLARLWGEVRTET